MVGMGFFDRGQILSGLVLDKHRDNKRPIIALHDDGAHGDLKFSAGLNAAVSKNNVISI